MAFGMAGWGWLVGHAGLGDGEVSLRDGERKVPSQEKKVLSRAAR